MNMFCMFSNGKQLNAHHKPFFVGYLYIFGTRIIVSCNRIYPIYINIFICPIVYKLLYMDHVQYHIYIQQHPMYKHNEHFINGKSRIQQMEVR